MVYVGPGSPVKADAAPVKVMAAVPVLRQLGATTTGPSLGWSTRLPAASTLSPAGSAACAAALTVVCAVAVLSPRRVSISSEDTTPELVTVPATLGRATTVTVAVAAFARVPRLQPTITVPAHVPWDAVAETSDMPAGRASVSVVFPEWVGPWFRTVKV